MLMSFPIGTRGEDVRDIATDVAERFFQSDAGHFDYIIAVHEDGDHPHAHLVLNRRSQEGEFFFLGRNHRFNYDDFRLAMVEEAEKYGVRLEATRRVDRGVVHYPARTSEVYAAKEEGRAPRERERVGQDLTRTLAEIANTRTVYHSLAAEASREAREDIAAALFRAGEVLARGGQVDRTGDVYMAEDQSFEDLRSLYAEKLARVQGMIAEKADAERPLLEKRLIEIQTQVQHMQPLGLRSSTLSDAPSEGGIYSEANIDASQRERLAEPDLRSRIDAALRGTGISTSEVVARIETGASNAALEHQWIANDLSKVAEARDLNLERRADLEQARDILNDVHVELGTLLESENVLRRDGVMEAEPVSERFHYHEGAVREGKRRHRYNPLLRIYQLKDPARQQMELQLLATLFLQSDNDRVQGLLKGGIDLFVAAGLLAFQRKRPTLGEIYRIAASGGNKQKEYFARGHEVDNRAAKLIFTRLASTNNDTLTSYVSLLMTSGLDQWQNPAIDEATAVSDFDFRTIRKKPFSVYLVVQPLMVRRPSKS